MQLMYIIMLKVVSTSSRWFSKDAEAILERLFKITQHINNSAAKT